MPHTTHARRPWPYLVLAAALGATGCSPGASEPLKQRLTEVGVAASSAVEGSRDALTTVGEISQAALSSTGEALEAVGNATLQAKSLADAALQESQPLPAERSPATTGGPAPKVYTPAP